MKVKNIHFKNHKVLKNLEIDFTKNGEVLDTIVIAGINGNGKTNLLKYIYDYFYNNYFYNNDLANSIEFLFEKEEKETLENNKKGIIFLVLGIFIVCAMTYFNPATGSDYSFSVKADNLSLPLIAYVFVSGMIAISAMVLPGISGSTILLIFGLYVPILGAIKNVLKLKFEYLPGIIIFGCGVLIGILVTVRVVRYLLKTFRSQTIYCIIGLMIGSIYAVIMGPTSLEIPKEPMSMPTFSIVFFAIGCILVPALEKLKTVLKHKNEEPEDIKTNCN